MSIRALSNRKRSRRANNSCRGTFETLESRLALSANLGFVGAFDVIGSGLYTFSGHNDGRGGGMVTDGAGNRYVTINGAYHSPGSSEIIDLDPGAGVRATSMTAGLVKLDPSGVVLWTAPLAATGTSALVVRANAAVDANQNVYLVGEFRGTMDVDPGPGVVNVTSTAGGADYGAYMVKLNRAGQLQWVRTLAANELTPERVAVDGAGNLIVASNFTAVPSDPPMDVDAGPGQFLVQEKGAYDLVVLKYSADGNFVWSRQFGNAGASQSPNVPTLGVNAQGDVFVSGAFQGAIDLDPGAGVHTVSNNDATFDRYLAHLDPAGNFVWGYATEGPGQISFRDIGFEPDGSIVLGGFFTGTTDFQPGAGSMSLTSAGTHSNGLVVKLNSDSSLAWARKFGGYGEMVTEIDVDNSGNIYLGGSFGAITQPDVTADFDPGPGVYELVRPSTYETAYLLSLTSAGDFRWAVPLGGNTGRAQVQGISVTPNGDVQVSGAFVRTADFNPDPALETWLDSGKSQTVFTATLTQSEPNPGAPTVDAGANQSVLITGSASLHGIVMDDGLPGPLSTTWSLQSGPGSVTFANASALNTTATFSTIGNYLLKLQATDGQLTTADYIQIVVNPVTAALSATADAYIDNGNATTNFGASATLTVSGKPDDAALLKWNLSSIPVGSTLQSATLTINVTNTSVNSYDIYELKRSWTESQATWKKANSATNWQSAGADGALDRGTTVLGTVSPVPYDPTATGLRTVTLNAAGLAILQGWINNPATNFGFAIQNYANANKDDLVFSSREAIVAANRPQLQVIYVPPNLAPQSLSALVALAPQHVATQVAAQKSLAKAAVPQPVRELVFAALATARDYAPDRRATLASGVHDRQTVAAAVATDVAIDAALARLL